MPVVFLGAWGTSYVIACLLALSAAGVPVEYVYESPGGKLTLRSESFSFDYRLNVLKLDRVSVREPGGKLVASVRALLLRDVIPGRRPIVAEGRDVMAVLERLPNGRFRFEDFLPKETKPPETEQPYEVNLRRISVLYLDQTTKPEWRKWTSISDLKLSGTGSSWSANAPVRINGAGVLQVSARANGRDLFFKFATSQLQVEDLLPHIAASPEGRDLPELRSIAVTSARVSGNGYLTMRPNKPLDWEFSTSVGASNFRYGSEASAADVSAVGRLSTSGFRGKVHGTNPGLIADFDGSWKWGERIALGGNLKAAVAGPNSLPVLLGRLLPKSALFANGTFSGWLSYPNPKVVAVAGELSHER